MRSLNKVMMIGHLVADPELRVTPGGKSIAKFRIATNRDWVSSDGEKNEMTDFHKVIVWQKLAEIVGKNLSKGAAIYLEGRIANSNYKDKSGNSHAITEIVGDEIKFLSYKKGKLGEEVNLVEVPVS